MRKVFFLFNNLAYDYDYKEMMFLGLDLLPLSLLHKFLPKVYSRD